MDSQGFKLPPIFRHRQTRCYLYRELHDVEVTMLLGIPYVEVINGIPTSTSLLKKRKSVTFLI